MNIEERIKSFSILGEKLRDALIAGNSRNQFLQLETLINNQHFSNPWFSPENVREAISSIANELTEENLIKWTAFYPALKENKEPVKVGVIMAGNIPLVGFHDFLSVLISGHNIIVKTSSKDADLILYISEILCSVNPEFKTKIEFTDSTLNGFDAVIATGSNNSSRYFEYYFGKYPNIIRKNRNSVAILEGDETKEELESLGKDIFSYYGLGCRNVSRLFLPEGYDVGSLQKNWELYSGCIGNAKYANNYDFNKAVYLVNKEKFIDSGFLLMKEEDKLSSPVSVVYYTFYKSETALKHQTDALNEKIQCIIGKKHIPFGKAQSPKLWDYADGIDTIDFLLKKKIAGLL
jgi:hypothetical protein